MITVRSRNIAAAVSLSLFLGVGATGTAAAASESAPAAAAMMQEPGVAAVVETQPVTVTEEQYQALLDRLAAVSAHASAYEAAAVLFPGDVEGQAEYVALAAQIAAAGAPPKGTYTRQAAVPVIILPYLAVIGRCVVGAIGSAGVADVINLVRNGQRLSAEARVDAAVGGCITAVVPRFLRGIANRARPYIVDAVVAIIIRLG